MKISSQEAASVGDLFHQIGLHFEITGALCEGVAREVQNGLPVDISTSYVERQNLTLRIASKRFARLSNGFSRKIDCHLAAVSLYVAFYNLCRSHEALRMTPAMALGITDHVWSVGELIEAALKAVPTKPTLTAPERRRQLRVILGGKD
jgi:hypothetical protein